MLAIEDHSPILTTTQKLDLIKAELGLDNTIPGAGGLPHKATDLNFSATPAGGSTPGFIVTVSMTHHPVSGPTAEYTLTFDKPFAGSSPAEATASAVDSLYEIVRAYDRHRAFTERTQDLHTISVTNPTHIFNGLAAGSLKGNEVNANGDAHRLLNAPEFTRQSLKHVVWPTSGERDTDGYSLVSLTLTKPEWEGVKAEKSTFSGSVVVGKGVFRECEFPGTRWSGTKFCPPTGVDPFSDQYDATASTNHNDWTLFQKCNLDNASFAYRGKDGMQGAVVFDAECSMKGASLMYLGPKARVRMEILEELIEAMRCTTVSPRDRRDPLSSPALMDLRKQYIDGLMDKAQTQLKGLMWDKTLIKAVGDRGPVYEGLLMRISRVAKPTDVILRIKSSEIDPSQLVKLLQDTPGVRTGRQLVDAQTSEKVIEICGEDMQGAPWEAEVRVGTGAANTGVIRVTGRSGALLGGKIATPQDIIKAFNGCGLPPGDPTMFGTYEQELQKLVGNFNVRMEVLDPPTSARYLLQLGDNIWVTLDVDSTQPTAHGRCTFYDGVGDVMTKYHLALLSSILDPLACVTGAPNRQADALELLKRLGHTRGMRLASEFNAVEREVV